MKYYIKVLEAGVWVVVDTADTWREAIFLASFFARKHGEDAVQITGGEGVNQP